MNLNKSEVIHKTFGNGVIVKQDDKYIFVDFSGDVKKFVYPDCFKIFLKLIDSNLSEVVEKKLKDREIRKKDEKIKIEKLEKRNNYMSHSQNFSNQNAISSDVIRIKSIEEFCKVYEKEITSESYYLQKAGSKKISIFDGKKIEHADGNYIYTFESDVELNYPEGTDIKLFVKDNQINAKIMDTEDFTITISCESNLGDNISKIDFSAQPWYLLDRLKKNITALAINPTNIVYDLICGGEKSIISGKISRGQDKAIYMSENQPITFVWGPPGTGKTQTLAKIALNHMEKGNRVLMLSYSNVSVDGAVLRVDKLSKNKKPGIYVRYGYPKNKDLIEHDFLASYKLAIYNHPDIMDEYKRLVKKRKTVSRKSEDYVELGKKIIKIKEGLKKEEKELVTRAQFVATTVSKAIVDSVIYKDDFDVVIFDEASMAYIPQVVFSASLAKKHFICMGDFKQLPPIVQYKENINLKADIFKFCFIEKAVNMGMNHRWLCMLDKQYRMSKGISGLAGQIMYNNLLKSDDSVVENRKHIVYSKPFYGHEIAMLDLSGSMSVCFKTNDNSRVNILSAFMSFSLAFEGSKQNSVGIITPYNSQSKLLSAMARDAMEKGNKRISCATVHQFQGSEKDIIIYDAVDCYRMTHPGVLLTKSGYANKLFNVALTRAKGKFIGVANIDFMDQKNLSKKLMFKALIDLQRGTNSFVNIAQCPKNNTDVMKFFSDDSYKKIFLKDVSNASKEICIDIPDGIVLDSFIKDIYCKLVGLRKNKVNIVIRTENKKNIGSALGKFAVENSYARNPIVVIDKKITWFGVPMSTAQFKTEDRVLKTTYRPVFRFDGRNTAKLIYSFSRMSNINEQAKSACTDENGNFIVNNFSDYVLAYKKCPVCGKPMSLKRGKSFYLACTDKSGCGNTDFVDTEIIEKYLASRGRYGVTCDKCGCSLEAKVGPYGVYVQCCSYNPHRYNLLEI